MIVRDYLDKAKQSLELLKNNTDTSQEVLVLIEALESIIIAVDRVDSNAIWGNNHI